MIRRLDCRLGSWGERVGTSSPPSKCIPAPHPDKNNYTNSISLGDIQSAPTRWVLAFFPGFLNFSSDAPKYRALGHPMRRNIVPLGGGICILFEICVKRPFQKCMGWGGGGR